MVPEFNELYFPLISPIQLWLFDDHREAVYLIEMIIGLLYEFLKFFGFLKIHTKKERKNDFTNQLEETQIQRTFAFMATIFLRRFDFVFFPRSFGTSSAPSDSFSSWSSSSSESIDIRRLCVRLTGRL